MNKPFTRREREIIAAQEIAECYALLKRAKIALQHSVRVMDPEFQKPSPTVQAVIDRCKAIIADIPGKL